MSHTQEPWKLVETSATGPKKTSTTRISYELRVDDGYFGTLDFGEFEPNREAGMDGARANAERIVACVNGCAGLNPAAYRKCVEALKNLLRDAQECDGHGHAPRESADAELALRLAQEGT